MCLAQKGRYITHLPLHRTSNDPADSWADSSLRHLLKFSCLCAFILKYNFCIPILTRYSKKVSSGNVNGNLHKLTQDSLLTKRNDEKASMCFLLALARPGLRAGEASISGRKQLGMTSPWQWSCCSGSAPPTIRWKYQGKVMQISMQMSLAKLKASDWQVCALWGRDGSLWKTCWVRSLLAISSVACPGGGKVGSWGCQAGTWLLSKSVVANLLTYWSLFNFLTLVWTSTKWQIPSNFK